MAVVDLWIAAILVRLSLHLLLGKAMWFCLRSVVGQERDHMGSLFELVV